MAEDADWISREYSAGLVSIVVPTFNRPELLKETLAALVGQTYESIQIIVVNNGTDEQTERVVRELQTAAPSNVEVEYNHLEQPNAPAARNAGAKLATGEFIVFMDDDDLVREDFLRSRIDALIANPGANLAFGLWQIFDVVDGQYRLLSERGERPSGLDFDWYTYFSQEWQLLLQGCVLRRELVAQAGPWKLGLKKGQDMEYKARLLAQLDCKPVFAGEDEPVYYRLHRASISQALDEEKLDSHVEVIDQMESMTVERTDYSQSKERTAECLWSHSFWLYSIGQCRRGYRFLRKAKSHDGSICRKKGFFASSLDSIGLDFAIGPLYYAISYVKKTLGFSKWVIQSTHDALPHVRRPSEFIS